MAKEGSTVGGMMDAFATAISLCLQYGVPLEGLVRKFSHQRFEPSGMTSNRDIPFAKSIVDYVFRWLGMTFLEDYRKANLPNRSEGALPKPPAHQSKAPEAAMDVKPSETGRADKASDKEVTGPVGAFLPPPPDGAKLGRQKVAVVSEAALQPGGRLDGLDRAFVGLQQDAPACEVCGSIMVRSGNCYKCHVCGSTSGCS
jgi:ribonucleoside-diphosphate reductase alpha chain